jgi:hypothetical protein
MEMHRSLYMYWASTYKGSYIIVLFSSVLFIWDKSDIYVPTSNSWIGDPYCIWAHYSYHFLSIYVIFVIQKCIQQNHFRCIENYHQQTYSIVLLGQSASSLLNTQWYLAIHIVQNSIEKKKP